MENREFNSSDYELASDYAWHLMQVEQLTETDAIIRAAKQYKISAESLQRYWDN